ncbi:hypothetical protein [Daejeonella sp.]|uniref:hypothetical protein n=1 Tax=Daejeonella sp. TaxID=2805397 RepID=UPI003983A9E7
MDTFTNSRSGKDIAPHPGLAGSDGIPFAQPFYRTLSQHEHSGNGLSNSTYYLYL